MSNNAQKLSVGLSLNKANRQKALDHIQLTGKHLPASIVSMKGSIATVKFETDGTFTLPNVTIPMHTPEWQRLPMQKGNFGVVMAGDVNIGNTTGLGPKTPPTFLRPGNLAPLVFLPVGNTSFMAVDGNKHVNYGPNGAQITDSAFKSFVGTDSTGGTLKGSAPTGTPDPTNITAATYKHTVTTDDNVGVQNTSTKKVKHTAPKVDVNASDSHNITSPQTNISGNASIAGIMSAALASVGGIAGAGGAPASAASGLQISGGTNPALAIAYQYVAPSTGATLTVSLASPILIIEPAGTLAALTINWPAGVDAVMVWVSCSQPVTTVTHSGATFAANASFASFPAGGGQFRFIYVAGTVNKWFRI